MKLLEPILADAAEIARIRRDLHAHPELCFQEERTADVIAQALTDWGIPIHRGLGLQLQLDVDHGHELSARGVTAASSGAGA